AGDEGPAYFSIGSPGMALKAITVGAYDDLTQKTWNRSGRGPTLDFIIKPDILAPGVNITSTKLINYDLPINISDVNSFSTYGTPIQGTNYTLANGTTAATAYVAGAIALLLQQAKFLDPESVKIILQETATPLSSDHDHDTWGAGLINITRAQEFITSSNLTSVLNTTRIFTPMLFYDGGVMNQNGAVNMTLLVSNYGSSIIFLNQTDANVTSHLIMGFFGIEYNGTFSWFYEGTLLREMHDVVDFFNYATAVSVIELGPFFIVIELEGWNNSNGFRTNIHVINSDPSNEYNVSLISSFSPDLFNNGINDTLSYESSMDLWKSNETWNQTMIYCGINASLPSTERDSSTNGSVFGHSNLLASVLGNTTIGSKYLLTPTDTLKYMENVNLSTCIAFGENETIMKEALNDTWKRVNQSSGYDLAIITVDNFGRMSRVGEVYSTRSLIMNIGRNTLSNVHAAFMLNRTEGNEGEVWLSFTKIGTLSPFEFAWVNTTYSPTKPDLYSAFWIAGTEATIYEMISYLPQMEQLLNGSAQLSSDVYAQDNMFAKHIFVQNESTPYLKKMVTVYPKDGGISPLELHFPSDFSIINFTLISNHELSDVSFQINSSNLTLVEPMFSISINNSISRYCIVSVLVTIPTFPFEGDYSVMLIFTSNGEEIGNCSFVFSIQYPRTRVMFYRPSPSLSLEGFNDFESPQAFELYEAFLKRLDTIYGNFFDFYNISRDLGIDIDDVSLLGMMGMPMELNETVLSVFDLIILCDPLVNLTSSEINNFTRFVNDGKSLYLWLEPDSGGLESVRALINNFGFNMSNNSTNGTATFNDFASHALTSGISQVTTSSVLYFNITSNSTISLINSSINDVFACYRETNPSNDV
ncbi:MAG: S8 family serine peptidase, partial [Candidatus Helarchaeales archaeon]